MRKIRVFLFNAILSLLIVCSCLCFGGAGFVNVKSNDKLAFINNENNVQLARGSFGFVAGDDAFRVLEHLNNHKNSLGIGDVYSELKADSTTHSALGTTYKFKQVYHGIEVFGRGISVNQDKNGNINLITGNYLGKFDSIDMTVLISYEKALALAKNQKASTASIRGLYIYSLSESEPSLCYGIDTDINDGTLLFLSVKDGKLIASIASANKSLGAGFEPAVLTQKDFHGNSVTLDVAKYTQSGELVLEDGYRNIYIYNIKNQTSGNLERYISSSGEFSDTLAVSALDSLAKSFDFYLNPSNIGTSLRGIDNSLDGIFNNAAANGEIQTVVYMHYGVEVENAFYAGTLDNQALIALGDGKNGGLLNNIPADIDIIAHEYQHAITDHQAGTEGLIYMNESGALNEAYSDIFAALVQGHDPSDDRFWQIGEFAASPFLRNMKNPSDTFDPMHMNEKVQYCYNDYHSHEDCDNGGVHYNSNILTYAQYKMYEFAPHIFDKATIGTLWHSALTQIPSDCSFSLFRQVMINSADILFGEEAAEAVAYGFNAVGIFELDNWDGDGTEISPFAINNLNDFVTLTMSVNNGNRYEGYYFEIKGDIDFDVAPYNTGEGFTLPDQNSQFGGIIFSNGGKIKNLYINNPTAEGSLFSPINSFGNIQGLEFENVNITAKTAAAIAISNHGMIANCNISGAIQGGGNVGAIASYNYGLILFCTNNASITLSHSILPKGEYAGGITGYNNGSIEECQNLAPINSDGDYVGGIAGYVQNGGIGACKNSGNISGQNNVGGIAGGGALSDIVVVLNQGSVSANAYVGGIIGFGASCNIIYAINSGDIYVKYTTIYISGAGGIAGYNQNVLLHPDRGLIAYSFNSGSVTGYRNLGGIASVNWGDIFACYNIGFVEDKSYSGSIVGESSSGAVEMNCFYDLSFSSLGAVEGSDLPQYNVIGLPSDEIFSGSFLTDFMGEDGHWALPPAIDQHYYYPTLPIFESYEIFDDFYQAAQKQKQSYQVSFVATGTYSAGTLLSDITLECTSEVEGTFTWENKNYSPKKNDENCIAVFTPTNPVYSITKKSVAVDIQLIQSNPETPTIDEIEYFLGITLNDITLPAFWTWNEPSTELSVGTESYLATYTPDDLDKYLPAVKSIELTIKKGTLNIEAPTTEQITYFVGINLADVALSDGWAWREPEQQLVVGSFKFTAIYVPENENFNIIEKQIDLVIIKGDASPTLPVITSINYTVSLKLSDIALPKNWEWVDGKLSLNAGTHEHFARYTPVDLANLNPITVVLSLVVLKAEFIPTEKASVETFVFFDGTLSDIALDEGWTWLDQNQKIIVGVNEAVAVFTPHDVINYELYYHTIIFNALKKTPVVPTVASLTFKEGLTLSDILLSDGWTWENPTAQIFAGTQKQYAVFNETAVYAYSKVLVEFEVEKAKKAPPTIEKTIAFKAGMTLKDIVLGGGWTWADDSIVLTKGEYSYTATFAGDDNYLSATIEITLTLREKLPLLKILLYVMAVIAVIIIIILIIIIVRYNLKRKREVREKPVKTQKINSKSNSHENSSVASTTRIVTTTTTTQKNTVAPTNQYYSKGLIVDRKTEREREKYKFVPEKPYEDYSETHMLINKNTKNKKSKQKPYVFKRMKPSKDVKKRVDRFSHYQDLTQVLSTPVLSPQAIQANNVLLNEQKRQQQIQQQIYTKQIQEVHRIKDQSVKMQEARRAMLYEQYLDSIDPSRKTKKKKKK